MKYRQIDQQPRLQARSKNIITVEGLQFRDLDGDGRLTPYEDWRLTPRERAEDLTRRLPMEHKAGLMVIGSQYMAGSVWVSPSGGMPDLRAGGLSLNDPPAHDPSGTYLRTEDSYTTHHPFTGAPLDAPKLYASAAHNAIGKRHQRRMILRDNPAARDLASWSNALQELAEASEFGIPVVLASNPRNHVSAAATLGVSEGSGIFSEWPGELGLAASWNLATVREFAETARREWRSSGLHKIYGYMADVPTEARWSRFNGTLGEDPERVAAMMRELVLGFQGEYLGPDSIAITVKHFPGGGVRTDGHDPHFPWGQTNDYPTAGSLEKYQLPPFRAAIDAGVASVMPYYSRPVNTSAHQLPNDLWVDGDTQFEEVAFAYNRAILRGLLRENLGFTGYINTDSGILESMAYGVEALSPAERWAKAVRAGSNVVSDLNDPSDLIAAVRTGVLDESELDESVTLLLEEMFALGLFENPYVDTNVADSVASDTVARERGAQAQRQSVTLLRNDRGALPIAAGRVFAATFRKDSVIEGGPLGDALAERLGAGTVVADPASADLAVVWVQPTISLFADDRPDTPISLDLRDLGIDVDAIRRIEATVPTVLVVNMLNPWLIGEVEAGAAAVVATYDVGSGPLASVLTGAFQPTGRLPLTVPTSADAVAESPRDVPGMYCGDDYPYTDAAGARYVYGFGLGFDGKELR